MMNIIVLHQHKSGRLVRNAPSLGCASRELCVSLSGMVHLRSLEIVHPDTHQVASLGFTLITLIGLCIR